MITIDDLKGLEWKFTAHADGSDKGGRFSINFASADLNGEKLEGWKKIWRSGGGESGYAFRGLTFSRLADVVEFLNKAIDVGDPEGRDD